MLTAERHDLIMGLLKNRQTVKIADLVSQTGASESTIRRDLTELEDLGLLERVHGGATTRERNIQELSVSDKSVKNEQEKLAIASYAASLVEEGEYLFLDAGTTTFRMIPFLKDKQAVVVTNGLSHVDALVEHGITTYLTAGYVKAKTLALVGPQATESLSGYRFDRCFLGANGFHPQSGFTTPDPEEAAVKKLAASLSRRPYVLADHTKWNQVSFARVFGLEEATLITGGLGASVRSALEEKTTVEVVYG
ncbi:DeoR/GlpR family DNA-binding transcription regulator [Bhargavaea ullalensis]|uniref:DeoR family fructose operon transcriptional repressor n=1 Tax=Bhargavaea ullalensis TaxID=1265685 RepID=A0ABV2G823_9BACL